MDDPLRSDGLAGTKVVALGQENLESGATQLVEEPQSCGASAENQNVQVARAAWCHQRTLPNGASAT